MNNELTRPEKPSTSLNGEGIRQLMRHTRHATSWEFPADEKIRMVFMDFTLCEASISTRPKQS